MHRALRQLGRTTWRIPNPNDTVRWGDQTWEEMMIGWYDMAVPVDMSLADAIPSQLERRRRRDRGGENGGGQNRDRGSEAAPAAPAGEAE